MKEESKLETKKKGKLKRILETLVIIIAVSIFILSCIGALLTVLDTFKETQVRSDTQQVYYDNLKSHCDNLAFSECQVVKVLSQTIELEPLTVQLFIKEDFYSSVYTPVTLTNLKGIPKESLANNYVKLLLTEGYVTEIEIVGSDELLAKEQDKAVKEFNKKKK